ncbi:MAG TPA: exodeoxyribonuclease V subunit alpha [Parachlamydiaceae bacterium]|nr:exodeoxyribonuclease V subunit alpha [Parachlamydiaceae bacterium]
MTGIARNLFLERTSKKLPGTSEMHSKWPLLEAMLRSKCLGFVDLALATHLLEPNADESVAALVCHLSIASRLGHVCVAIEEGNITPSIETTWISNEAEYSNSMVKVDSRLLTQLIVQGSQKVPAPFMWDVNGPGDALNSPLIKNDKLFYLQRSWNLETFFLKNFANRFVQTMSTPQLADNGAQFPLDQIIVDREVKVLVAEGKLLKEQAAAVMMACRSSLTLITGGPGTGKTYTAGMLLRIIWGAVPASSSATFNIALAAPTGKAAANLEASINSAMKQLEGFQHIKAQTLHQLLGIKNNRVNQTPAVLGADLVLVDESSMIDIKMMGQLFAAIKPGARLILLGDRHQLPSVEAGSLFADLTSYFLSRSDGQVQVVELKTCLRTELKSIVDLADRIKSGNDDETLALLESHAEGIGLVKFDEHLSIYEQKKHFLDYVIPRFPFFTKLPEDPSLLLEQFAKFRILTPMRNGPFGVDALNALIHQAMVGKMTQKGCFIVPIMVMQNDYRHGLFNGEVGLLVRETESGFALFPSREPGGKMRRIPSILMPRYEYAYCLSVHKSQGSEFEHVVLLLPEGTQGFGREALYTGVTRAKRRLEIWSKPHVLSQMMKLQALRQSGIVKRLSA